MLKTYNYIVSQIGYLSRFVWYANVHVYHFCTKYDTRNKVTCTKIKFLTYKLIKARLHWLKSLNIVREHIIHVASRIQGICDEDFKFYVRGEKGAHCWGNLKYGACCWMEIHNKIDAEKHDESVRDVNIYTAATLYLCGNETNKRHLYLT